MNRFASLVRYAWILALALGAWHVSVVPARAEKCGEAAPRHTGASLSSLASGPPVAVGTIRDRVLTKNEMRIVRFGVARYFTDPNEDALTYTAESTRPSVATAEICGNILKIVAEDNGKTIVTVTASDGANDATQSFNVRVGNRPPVAEGTIPETTFTKKTSPVSFVVSPYFSDPDPMEDLTYTVSLSSTDVVGASITDNTLTLAAVSKGMARVTVEARDLGYLPATQSFMVTIANSRPDTVGTMPKRRLRLASSPTLYFDVSQYFTDVDDDVLTYTVTSSPSAFVRASIPSNSSTLTLSAVKAGEATIEVAASDGEASSIPQRFTVNVETVTPPPPPPPPPPPNQPPIIIKNIPDRNFTVGDAAATFNLNEHFKDPEEAKLGYEATSSDIGVATVNSMGSPLRITPKGAGSATITVTATDPGELSVAQTVEVEVTEPPPPNRPPIIIKDIPDLEFTVGDVADTFNLNKYFEDPDDDDLEYDAELLSSGVATASITDSTLTIRAVSAGSATVTVTAMDPGKLSVDQTVEVEVTEPPPLKAEITGPTRIESGTSHTWRSTVTGGRPSYSYSWYVSTRCTTLDHLRAEEDEPCTPLWSSAGSGTSITRTITTTSAYARIRLVVSDSDSPSSSVEDTHSVDVYQPNNDPEPNGTVAARTLTLGSSATSLNVLSWFTDKDDDRLRYTVASSPTGIVNASIPLNSSTLTLSTVKAGTTTVTVTARDPSNASAKQSFSVRVNRRPVADEFIPAQTVTVGGASGTLNLSEYFSDPDNDNLRWTAWSSNTSRATVSVSGSTLTIKPVSAGTVTVRITATDTHGANVSQTVTVNIATAAGFSASIRGPSTVLGPDRNTWTASVSGGTGPYAYRWRYTRRCVGDNLEADSAREICTEWASGGSRSSLTVTLTAASTIELTVTDANNDSVTTTLSVRYSGL